MFDSICSHDLCKMVKKKPNLIGTGCPRYLPDSLVKPYPKAL